MGEGKQHQQSPTDSVVEETCLLSTRILVRRSRCGSPVHQLCPAPAGVTPYVCRCHLLFQTRYKKRGNSRTCYKTALPQAGIANPRVGTTQCANILTWARFHSICPVPSNSRQFHSPFLAGCQTDELKQGVLLLHFSFHTSKCFFQNGTVHNNPAHTNLSPLQNPQYEFS